MGHLVCVLLDGKMKVAQFGLNQGLFSISHQLKDFISRMSPTFCDKISALQELDPDYVKAVRNLIEDTSHHPVVNEHSTVEILDMIDTGCVEAVELRYHLGFNGSSVNCNHAYVLNLDTNLVEFYSSRTSSYSQSIGWFADNAPDSTVFSWLNNRPLTLRRQKSFLEFVACPQCDTSRDINPMFEREYQNLWVPGQE